MADELYISVETSAEAKVLLISVAARMAGMHPQTLRQYDRMGLVQPGRSAGGGRRYSVRDVQMLREVQRLSQEEGVNLAGIKRIIELENMVTELQQRLLEVEAEVAEAHQRIAEMRASAFPRSELVPATRRPSAIVVWRPH